MFDVNKPGKLQNHIALKRGNYKISREITDLFYLTSMPITATHVIRDQIIGKQENRDLLKI